MMGELSPQGNLFGGDRMHLDHVGRESFYGWLALEGPRVFPDSAFSAFYVLDNGRRSVPPSRMIRLVLLQGYEKVSDAEAIERARFDLRWKVALGIEDHEGVCAKFTLQTFRSKLLLKEKGRELLKSSVKICREAGLLSRGKLCVGIDTSPIFGRGAVKDTYNLVADGMAKLLRTLSAFETPLLEQLDVEGFARGHDLGRYVEGASIKGQAELDWDDEDQRVVFLTGLVADVHRALVLAGRLLDQSGPETDGMRSASSKQVREAMALLEQLVAQDVEVSDEGQARLKQGVAKDRVVSAHDPEMRHGRKSKRARFDGHKGEIVVDLDSGTILDASCKAGNANDAHDSLACVDRAEHALQQAFADEAAQASGTGQPGHDVEDVGVNRTVGDCAYGSAQNRREFADAGRELIAKQPRLQSPNGFTKDDFPVDEQTGARTCPAGHTVMPKFYRRTWNGQHVTVRHYRWAAEVCAACPHNAQCIRPLKQKVLQPERRGRSIEEHPEEALLAQARAHQRTSAFKQTYRRRQTVEHRLARMMQLGARQARYIGRAKTELQWLVLATVANLTLAIAHNAKSGDAEQDAFDKARATGPHATQNPPQPDSQTPPAPHLRVTALLRRMIQNCMPTPARLRQPRFATGTS